MLIEALFLVLKSRNKTNRQIIIQWKPRERVARSKKKQNQLKVHSEFWKQNPNAHAFRSKFHSYSYRVQSKYYLLEFIDEFVSGFQPNGRVAERVNELNDAQWAPALSFHSACDITSSWDCLDIWHILTISVRRTRSWGAEPIGISQFIQFWKIPQERQNWMRRQPGLNSNSKSTILHFWFFEKEAKCTSSSCVEPRTTDTRNPIQDQWNTKEFLFQIRSRLFPCDLSRQSCRLLLCDVLLSLHLALRVCLGMFTWIE